MTPVPIIKINTTPASEDVSAIIKGDCEESPVFDFRGSSAGINVSSIVFSPPSVCVSERNEDEEENEGEGNTELVCVNSVVCEIDDCAIISSYEFAVSVVVAEPSDVEDEVDKTLLYELVASFLAVESSNVKDAVDRAIVSTFSFVMVVYDGLAGSNAYVVICREVERDSKAVDRGIKRNVIPEEQSASIGHESHEVAFESAALYSFAPQSAHTVPLRK
jgi:hypothetical protein